MLWTMLVAILAGVLASSAAAQVARQSEPGKFDYYLLSL